MDAAGGRRETRAFDACATRRRRGRTFLGVRDADWPSSIGRQGAAIFSNPISRMRCMFFAILRSRMRSNSESPFQFSSSSSSFSSLAVVVVMVVCCPGVVGGEKRRIIIVSKLLVLLVVFFGGCFCVGLCECFFALFGGKRLIKDQFLKLPKYETLY